MCFCPKDIKSDEELVIRDIFPRNKEVVAVLPKISSKTEVLFTLNLNLIPEIPLVNIADIDLTIF